MRGRAFSVRAALQPHVGYDIYTQVSSLLSFGLFHMTIHTRLLEFPRSSPLAQFSCRIGTVLGHRCGRMLAVTLKNCAIDNYRHATSVWLWSRSVHLITQHCSMLKSLHMYIVCARTHACTHTDILEMCILPTQNPLKSSWPPQRCSSSTTSS